MAKYDDVTATLYDAIKDLAEKAKTGGRTDAETYSLAAKNLAEANAWLTSAAQPH